MDGRRAIEDDSGERSRSGFAGRRSKFSRRPRMGRSESLRARYFSLFVGFDQVALTEVLVVIEPDAALEALTDLTHVVPEPPERSDRTLPEDDAVAEEADLRAPGDDTAADHAPGDGADARDPDDLPDLGLAGDDL